MSRQPLVLLDEDQQRSLYGHNQVRPDRRSSGHQTTSQLTATNEPRTNFRSAGSDPPQNRQQPTHSTSTNNSSGRGRPNRNKRPSGSVDTAYTTNSSPRTNFTSRLPPSAGGNGGFPEGMSFPRASDDYSSQADEQDAQYRSAAGTSNLRLSVTYTMCGVGLGLVLGLVLGSVGISSLAASWVALPGTLFLRVLKCLVVPYVFCSVAVAIGDIVFVGKVSVVGSQTVKIFGLFWVTTCCLGMGVALLFRPLFRLNTPYEATTTNAVGFTCSNGFMLDNVNGSLVCSANSTEVSGSHQFTVDDVNDSYQKDADTTLATLSLSAQIISILELIVPKNIFASMADADLLSIIAFAAVLGSIAGRNYFTRTRQVNYLYLLLLQMRNALFLGLEWIIWLSPGAFVFIVAGQFASNQESLNQFHGVYLYVVANFVAAFLQIGILYPLLVFLLTRCNPYTHMAHMARAYLFAFGCSSSLATAPVTLGCIRKARVCSQSLANFVISLGVVSNLSACGFYCPLAVIFLAESSGNGSELTTLRLVLIFALTLLASMGTPAIPSGATVLIATMYQTVFGVSDLPSTWTLFLAMDFFVDRIATVSNVNDDIMALKIIAENTDETILGDHLGERE